MCAVPQKALCAYYIQCNLYLALILKQNSRKLYLRQRKIQHLHDNIVVVATVEKQGTAT